MYFYTQENQISQDAHRPVNSIPLVQREFLFLFSSANSKLLKFSSQQFQNNGFSINPEHFTDVISTYIESKKERKKKQADIETNTQQERDLFKNI